MLACSLLLPDSCTLLERVHPTRHSTFRCLHSSSRYCPIRAPSAVVPLVSPVVVPWELLVSASFLNSYYTCLVDSDFLAAFRHDVGCVAHHILEHTVYHDVAALAHHSFGNGARHTVVAAHHDVDALGFHVVVAGVAYHAVDDYVRFAFVDVVSCVAVGVAHRDSGVALHHHVFVVVHYAVRDCVCYDTGDVVGLHHVVAVFHHAVGCAQHDAGDVVLVVGVGARYVFAVAYDVARHTVGCHVVVDLHILRQRIVRQTAFVVYALAALHTLQLSMLVPSSWLF